MEGLMSLIHSHAIPVSAAILLVAYVFIATEKIPKVTVALLGAALTLILGLLGQDKLVNGEFDLGYFINFVDFNVIFLLVSDRHHILELLQRHLQIYLLIRIQMSRQEICSRRIS